MTTPRHYRLCVGGYWKEGTGPSRTVIDPFTGRTAATYQEAGPGELEQVLEAASEAFQEWKNSIRAHRALLLQHLSTEVDRRREALVQLMIEEAGKPRTLADGEVTRCASVFRISADEARRFGGELLPADGELGAQSYASASCAWVPRGPVLAIGPFNFPLNLLAHKVGPALACGAPVILKPPPQAPGCAQLLVEAFHSALEKLSQDVGMEFPKALLQLVYADHERLKTLMADPRIGVVSFTGGEKGGAAVQAAALGKKVVLELGGNAAVYVHEDADVRRAASRVNYGGYAYSGQVCISVQRVLVHSRIYDAFMDSLIAEVRGLKSGNPQQEGLLVGPMIDAQAASRVQEWIAEAVRMGAKVKVEATREGNVLSPALLEGAPRGSRLWDEEVFGPVMTVSRVESMDEATVLVNDSRFGIQAGLFTDQHLVIERAFRDWDVGGIIVNEIPTFRADALPYGGMKSSGLGREGPRYAMESYCERKILMRWRYTR